jgi:hypothetical protein
VINAAVLAASTAVAHGFFTRRGGVSTGTYASLNCGLGSGDAPERVHSNRARAMARLSLAGEALATAYQIHSSAVAVVEQPWPAAARPRVDGLVTRTPGVALGILTADCAPVLLADAEAGIVGAAHAGWRGALAGIIEATVTAMEDLGANRTRIAAAVGPCIGQQSYEVGAEFRTAFVAGDGDPEAFFVPSDRPGRYRFDLAGYVAQRLARLSLAAVEALGVDTCAEADRFFSYRRTTLDGGGGYGRQLSAIALAP